MCGRYVSPDSASIERQWQLRRSPGTPFPARYNVSPGTEVPVLLLREKMLELRIARWGLIPHWWTQPAPPRLAHNARSEEAISKPLWRDAMRGARALMPAVGWYEWREKDRQPFYFARSDGRLSCIAALFSLYQGKLTCALLTRGAPAPIAQVHDRMPIVLDEAAQERWLATGALPPENPDLLYHPVSKLVNGSRAEGPELIEALAG
ncbi:MAG: SOS response-associated peptidase [Clostridia bacterium]